MVNVNITIPDDLHQKLKLRAVKENRTLKDLVISLLEEIEKHDKS